MENVEKIVKQVAEEVEGSVYAGYSGRGMFGKTCFGVVCENHVRCVEVAILHGLTGARYDNMGKDYIVYWPNPLKI